MIVDDSSPVVARAKSREQLAPSSFHVKTDVNTKRRPVRETWKSMHFPRRKRTAARFVVIDLLEECTEDESGES